MVLSIHLETRCLTQIYSIQCLCSSCLCLRANQSFTDITPHNFTCFQTIFVYICSFFWWIAFSEQSTGCRCGTVYCDSLLFLLCDLTYYSFCPIAIAQKLVSYLGYFCKNMWETSDFTRKFAILAYYFANKLLWTLLENTIKDLGTVAEIKVIQMDSYGLLFWNIFLQHTLAHSSYVALGKVEENIGTFLSAKIKEESQWSLNHSSFRAVRANRRMHP